MAKLAIDSASLQYLVINREIFIPNREIGRLSLFYQKSGDLPQNRETWKLCDDDDDGLLQNYHSEMSVTLRQHPMY